VVFKKTVDLFLKIYSTAIGNFLVQHICEGGIYLVGSVTKAILPLMKKIDILK
jgi:glucokinase